MGECQDTVEILKYPHTVFDDSSKIRSMRYILQNIDLIVTLLKLVQYLEHINEFEVMFACTKILKY